MTTLIVPDPHAHPDHNNNRAEYLGKMIYDLQPQEVICLGDGADMPSLCSYDKGKRSFIGKTYAKDVESWLDFQDKMWYPYRKNKKRLPLSTYFIGNHEQRIEKTLDEHHELEGIISLKDLELDLNWDQVVKYDGSTPGTLGINDVLMGHFMVSGVMNRPISGVNMARQLIQRVGQSCIVGHNHTLNFELHKTINGKESFGLSAGCFIDYETSWAGQGQNLWWSGITVLEHDSLPQFIPFHKIRRAYS